MSFEKIYQLDRERLAKRANESPAVKPKEEPKEEPKKKVKK